MNLIETEAKLEKVRKLLVSSIQSIDQIIQKIEESQELSPRIAELRGRLLHHLNNAVMSSLHEDFPPISLEE